MALVSIIIPTKIIDSYVRRCLWFCERLPEEKEILCVTDKECPGFPAAKRNWAMERAKGEIFAFIDSDAYPSRKWLTTAIPLLEIFPAVCGPGVLPPDASFKERIADQVHRWMFCSYRVRQRPIRIVRWFPTFNLIVRREIATRFDNYLTGEDDRFGLKIRTGILYHPDILVYHNRRGIWFPLWEQFGTYGLHKGHFSRLAFIAWLTTLWMYAVNFAVGFFKRRL